MQIKQRKILVTGGAGFIGSHLADALIKKGARVLIIDNLSTGRKENINPKATFYRLDVNDKKVAGIFKKEKPEIIFHLAFNTNVSKSVEDPLFDARSVTGSLNIFNAAVKNNVRKIIMASSSFVYGNYSPRLFPIAEERLPQPVSPYAVSKLASENYLRFFNQTYKLPIVIFRYATTYGPRQVKSAMADYIRKIASGRGGDMFGDGNLTRDYVFVDDIVRANLLALDYGGNKGEPIFNLGSSREVTLNNLHKKIAAILGQPDIKPVYHAGRSGEILRYCLSHSKAKKELGWQPTVGLDEGLRKTVSHFLKNKA